MLAGVAQNSNDWLFRSYSVLGVGLPSHELQFTGFQADGLAFEFWEPWAMIIAVLTTNYFTSESGNAFVISVLRFSSYRRLSSPLSVGENGGRGGIRTHGEFPHV